MNPNDSPVLSQKKRSGRRRGRRVHRDPYEHPREEYVFLQHVMEQQAQLREQIRQQKLEINQLQEHIRIFRNLSKKIDDEVETVVQGICGIQRHLEELDCQRRFEMQKQSK